MAVVIGLVLVTPISHLQQTQWGSILESTIIEKAVWSIAREWDIIFIFPALYYMIYAKETGSASWKEREYK